jgi:hypothetical protein
MTPERLREIAERVEKATAGPWFDIPYDDPRINEKPREIDITVSCSWPDPIDVCWMKGGVESEGIPQAKKDATFIAYARQDIPDLLAEITRLRAELAGAYERLSRLGTDFGL